MHADHVTLKGRTPIKDYKALALGYLLRAISHSKLSDKTNLYAAIKTTQRLSKYTELSSLLKECINRNETSKFTDNDYDALDEIIELCKQHL